MKNTVMVRSMFVLLGMMLFCGLKSVAQTAYEYKTYVSSLNDTLLFRSLDPVRIQSGKKYPLVIFLHGSGERGCDNETQLKHGAGLFLNPVNRERFPAYVLFPQCPRSQFGLFIEEPSGLDGRLFPEQSPMTPYVHSLKELLNMYMMKDDIDVARIYIIGLSMGGMTAFDMVCRFPDVFAAAVPICGAVNLQRLSKVRSGAFRIFHGEKDEAVPVECSREAYDVLRKNGVRVEYVEFYGCNHLSWNPAFNLMDFMDWLFMQKK